jgi:16S rRNA (adenine1518-N6/adenine1519-N6)-dimethyltransferase
MLKKSLSQHLIRDRNVLSKIVRLASVGKDDTVLEIGAGQGDLTKVLADHAGRLYAVEFDERFHEYLDPLQKEKGNVQVIFADFLSLSINSLVKEESIKVVANIPYKITGPILFKLINEREKIGSVYLTIQKEIGERIVSRPRTKAYGSLSAVCQLLADVRILFTISASVFVPPPKVDSVLISMVFKDSALGLSKELISFIRICFAHKRKHLRYTLLKHFPPASVHRLYEAMGFSDSVRAEEIEPERFPGIYQALL